MGWDELPQIHTSSIRGKADKQRKSRSAGKKKDDWQIISKCPQYPEESKIVKEQFNKLF